MDMKGTWWIEVGLGVAAALVLVACSTTDRTPAAPNFSNTTPGSGHLDLCKVGPSGTTATFSITHTGTGTLPLGDTVTVSATAPFVCQYWDNNIWLPGAIGDPPDTITITEIGHTPGVTLQRIVTGVSALNGYQEILPPQNWITMVMDDSWTSMAIFKNDTLLTQGCTPGYWKVDQHFDSWPSPYTPGQLFGSVFANAFPGKSMLQVLWFQGGGLQALGRHAVSALLNAASPDVDYPLTVTQVIAMFNAAYASGDYETMKNQFAAYNELLCPLN